MDPMVVSTATMGIDWAGYGNTVANTVLPDLLKITVQMVILPLIAMAGREAARYFAKSHFKFLVKWAGQKIERGTEEWAKRRLDLVVDSAAGSLWLKWMTKEEMHQMVEAAVAEWNQEFYQALGTKP